MKITKSDVDKLNSQIKFLIEKDDYIESYTKTLKDYQRKTHINGFRPGKVPFGMIRKMYGSKVLVDEINNIISEKLPSYLSENNIKIIGEPLPKIDDTKKIDWNKDDSFEFDFDIGLSPEFELNVSKQNTVKNYQVNISKKMIDERIQSYAQNFGTSEKLESITDNDLYIKIDLMQLTDTGPISQNDVPFMLKNIESETERKKFIGKKIGDTIKINLQKAFTNLTDISAMLNIDKEKIKDINPQQFIITIKEINQFIPAKIDKELFEKVFSKNVVKTKEKFSKKVKEVLASEWEGSTNFKLSLDIKEMLIKKTKFDLPEAFLKRWLNKIQKEENEKKELNFEKSLIDIRWMLIKNKIIEDQKIEISDDELLEIAKKRVKAQYVYYGLSNIPDQEIEKYASQQLQNSTERSNYYNEATDEKVIQYLEQKITIEKARISSEKFTELVK